MIRFSCPFCKSAVESPERHADAEAACGNCWRRIRVPPLPLSKTVLGLPVPTHQSAAASTPLPRALARSAVATKPRADQVVCPACGRLLKVKGGPASQKVGCSGCGVLLSFGEDGTLSVASATSNAPPPAPSRPAAPPAPERGQNVPPKKRRDPPVSPAETPTEASDFEGPDSSLTDKPRKRTWKPYLFGITAFLLGVAALPATIVVASNWLGVLLAALGAFLALAAVVSSLANRGIGFGLSLLSFLACGAALFGAVVMGAEPVPCSSRYRINLLPLATWQPDPRRPRKTKRPDRRKTKRPDRQGRLRAAIRPARTTTNRATNPSPVTRSTWILWRFWTRTLRAATVPRGSAPTNSSPSWGRLRNQPPALFVPPPRAILRKFVKRL